MTTAGALGVALAVAMHLGLGTAVLAASRGWGWTAMSLVVILVVAVLGHLGAVTLRAVRAVATRRKANAVCLRDDR